MNAEQAKQLPGNTFFSPFSEYSFDYVDAENIFLCKYKKKNNTTAFYVTELHSYIM